jgi:hypothetical protein
MLSYTPYASSPSRRCSAPLGAVRGSAGRGWARPVAWRRRKERRRERGRGMGKRAPEDR